MVEKGTGTKEPVLECLRNNFREVILGNSSACTILAYDLREGGKKLMAPPLHLPTGEGPFPESERKAAFRKILREVLGVDTEEELERFLGIVKVTTEEEEPGRIKKDCHWDTREWQFPTFYIDVYLIIEKYHDSQAVLGEAWHLKIIKPKSIWEKAIGRLKKSL